MRPRDEEQLRRRLHEVEAEAEQLRAALGEPRKIGGPDRLIHTNSGQYKQIAEILDASADAIISVDERGLISRFNRGAESTFGYRSSEIIGRPLDILIPDRFRARHRAHIMKFDRTADNSRLMNERGEIFGLHKNGAEFPAEASIVKLKNGNSLVFTVILRDITERKEAETALRESEAQLRQAQTMSRIGAMVWDEITDCCEYCSSELAAILGSTPELLIKASRSSGWVQERIHPDDRDEYNAVVTRARDTATPYDVEFRFLHNDGHLIHLREMGEPETDEQG
ncbi:MAG: PAS domain S-box protein, partial [Alphaproteobacteria bacterium]|nr:PAS domain S-box protein [Alphaproteobacteria bacterium]